MAQQQSPWIEGAYGWNFGEGGWNSGMDQNLLKFSFMFDRNVDSIVASLPAAVNGQAHYLTTDNRLYFAVGATYFSTPIPKWFVIVVRSTGQTHQFNGTSLVQIDSPSQLDSRLDAIELTISSLGTAAFKTTEFFASKAQLDVESAAAARYTDTLRSDLANNTSGTNGAGQVGFLPAGSGVVGRTSLSKMRELVSIKDFGAVGDGVTNDYPAWSALVGAYPTARVTCLVPAGTFTSVTAITIPKNIQVVMLNGAKILSTALVHFTNVASPSANSSNVKPGEPQLGADADQGKFNYLELSGDTASGGNIVAQFADLVDTTQNVLSNAGGSFARYSEVRHGGASSSGGFVGLGGFSYMTSAGNPTAAVKDSVGVAGYAASLGFNYGGTSGAEKGSIFGSNFYARMDSGATFFSNLTASEFNTEVRTGASVAYKSGLQVVGVSTDAVAGSLYDCAIAISNQSGAIGRQHGILFGPMNGVSPIATTGTIIGYAGTPTVGNGIDFSNVTFNTSILKSKAVNLLDGALVLGDTTTATRFLDFKTAGAPPNYNARLLCQGGSGADGSGDVSLLAAVVRLPAQLPHNDAASNIGSASLRYNTIFASNGTINTSDAREKTEVRALTKNEIAASRELAKEIGAYKFLSAIQQKGDGARNHIGMTVQRAIEILESHDLIAESYSFICHDVWDDGDRYGFKMDELYAFICAGFEARLTALEASL